MRDFATKLPRLAEMALRPDQDVEELVAVAAVDIRALGWDAPYSLLAMVASIEAASRKAGGPPAISFDDNGNGPHCQHGVFPMFCPLHMSLWNAKTKLVDHLAELARAQ